MAPKILHELFVLRTSEPCEGVGNLDEGSDKAGAGVDIIFASPSNIF